MNHDYTKTILDILAMLQAYIRFETVANNIAAYNKAIDLFIQYAKQDGIAYQKIVLDSGLPMLILTVEGTDALLQALLLNHHMDVVPAQKEGWIAPPFEGQVIDDKLYGRGAQDMKGVGVCHYHALKNILQDLGVPRRTIHVSLVPDEEGGGFQGTGCFVKIKAFRSFNIGHIIDEGAPSEQKDNVIVYLAERKPLQISITAQGHSGHSSELLHTNAMHTLLVVLQQFLVLHEQSVANFYANKAFLDEGLQNSFHITSVYTDPVDASINTIPMYAKAIIDIRVAPHISMETIIHQVKNILAQYKNIEWKVIASAEDFVYQDPKNDLQLSIERVCLSKKYSLKKRVFEGATDMRFYRALGIEAIGCTPFEDPYLLHASNEHVSLSSLEQAYHFFYAVLKDFCYEKGLS